MKRAGLVFRIVIGVAGVVLAGALLPSAGAMVKAPPVDGTLVSAPSVGGLSVSINPSSTYFQTTNVIPLCVANRQTGHLGADLRISARQIPTANTTQIQFTIGGSGFVSLTPDTNWEGVLPKSTTIACSAIRGTALTGYSLNYALKATANGQDVGAVSTNYDYPITCVDGKATSC